MKKDEIVFRLNVGEKLTHISGGYGRERYYIGEQAAESKLTEAQFNKYRALCNKSENNFHNKWFNGQSCTDYYWIG